MSNTDDEEEAVRVQFIIEQLKLCNQSEQGRRYSPGVTIFAYTIYSTSTAAYKALLRQNTVILPSISTLKRVTKRLDSKSGLDNSEYISLRASKLNNFGMHIILMIDEIYLGKRVELSGGDIYGFTEDGVVAHTALCFMIRSLTSKYRDVVAIYPMSSCKAETIEQCFKEVLQQLHNAGFTVVAILTDNHSSNRKFFVNLCGGSLKTFVDNPVSDGRIYLIFDPTHNIKNLYNNFQKRRLFRCPGSHPILKETTEANFDDIDKVFELESTKPLRMAHKLTKAVLNPKSIEKTSVKLSAAVIHESTINALREYGFKDTSTVLEAFLKLWNVLNVKNTSIGKHKRDISRDPILSAGDWKLTFLEQFADFFEVWEAFGVSE